MSWVGRIIGALFLLGFIVLLLFAYHHFEKSTREGGDPMEAVPPSAGIALRTSDPQALLEKLEETNIIWQKLVHEGFIADIDTSADQWKELLGDERLQPLLQGKGGIVSLHSIGSRSVGAQFSFGIPGNVDPERVLEGVKARFGELEERTYEEVSLFEEKEGDYAFAVNERTLILSSSPILVEDALRHMKRGDAISKREGFQRVERTTSSDVDANLFVHYPVAERLLSKSLRESVGEILAEKGKWAQWSGLDLLLRPRSLLLTGFTESGPENPGYLSSFKGQEPRAVRIPEVLPSRTAYFQVLGWSDLQTYLERYENYLQEKNEAYGREQALKRISDSCRCDVEKKATGWIAQEMGAAYLEPGEEDPPEDHALIAVRTFDRKAALRGLKEISGIEGEEGSETLPGFEEKELYRASTDGLYRTLFGKAFPRLENPYFLVLEEYVLLAERKAVLREFLRDRELGRTLARDVDYDSFSDELSQRSNLLIYSNIGRSPHLYSSLLRENGTEWVEENVDLLREFQALGVQFSVRPDGRFYSNVHLEYDPVYKKETASLWESQLDTSIRSRPYLVRNHYTDGLEAFVQDVDDRVYLVSNTGEVLWKKQLEGPIMSEVRQIDVYRNGKLQLLFNTRQKVHLLDRKGRYVDGFPIELSEPATAPMALFDYAGNKIYRLLVPCADNKLHMYDKHGSVVEGWDFEGTEERMIRPPQHIRIEQKDYILITDSSGAIHLLDRRGNIRYEVDERIAPSEHTPLVVNENKSIGASELVYTDTTGAVVKLRFEGKRSRFHLKEEMEEPYFFTHKDLESDGKKESILLEGNELAVFNTDEEQRFAYSFDSTLVDPPLYFHSPEEMGMVGVLDRKSKEAYLFDRTGALKDGMPLFGSTLFSVGDINRDGYLELVIGSEEGDLYCYSLN